MLSRVANNLYWLSRYLERAENLARVVNVNRFVTLDTEADDIVWRATLYATCSEAQFEEAKAADEAEDKRLDPARYITLSPRNSDSIVQCIANARENARMVRDQISEEIWLEINSFHLFMKSKDAKTLYLQQPDSFYSEVIKFCLLVEGLIESTIIHGEGWQFIQAGKFLERADKTSRILDMLTYYESTERTHWISILRSCSGFAAFRTLFRGDITEKNVVSFLLFSQSFPRSVRFCLHQLDQTLHSISGMPLGSYSNEAERLAGSVLARLNFSSTDNVWEEGLHEFVDSLQSQFNDIGQQIFETYVLLPSEIQSAPSRPTVQSQWQQQQHDQQQQ